MDKEKHVTEYNDDDKLMAVKAFFITRSSVKASKLIEEETGKLIPPSTIRRWKQDEATWQGNMSVVQEQFDSKLDGALTKIIDMASDKILKALEYGDRKMSPQGVLVNVPVPASELIRIQKQALDQRNVLRGEIPAGDKDKSPFNLDKLGDAFVKRALKVKTKDSNLVNDLTEKTIQ